MLVSDGYPDLEIGIGHGDNQNPFVVGKTRVNDGEWHFLQGQYRKIAEGRFELSLVVDGVPQGTTSGDGPILYDGRSTHQQSTIGARKYGSTVDWKFNGAIDNVKVSTFSLCTGSECGQSEVEPEPLPDNAFCKSLSVPDTVKLSTRPRLKVTMENSGTTTWTRADGYRLAVQLPEYGKEKVMASLGKKARVAPGSSYAFNFRLTSKKWGSLPKGTLQTEWYMYKKGFGVFGEPCRKTVTVV